MTTQRTVLAPVATFLLVGAVTLGAVALGGGVGGRRGPSGPAPLALTDPTSVDAVPASAASGATSGYRLIGPLPQGRPADAAVWQLLAGTEPGTAAGTVSGTVVARLAAALGEQRPMRLNGGWRVGGLGVRDDGQWSWSACAHNLPTGDGAGADRSSVVCATAEGGVPTGATTTSSGWAAPGTGVSVNPPVTSGSAAPGTGVAVNPPVTSGSTAPGTAVAVDPPVTSGSTTPSTPPGFPPPAPPAPGPALPFRPSLALTPARVAAAAGPVFTAVGLRVADARLDGGSGSATVTPVVGGLRTSGYETRVQLDRTGRLLDGSGWLTRPVRGDRYPVITAPEAFAQLPPVMRALAPCLAGAPCRQPADLNVVGAELGLMLKQRVGSGSVLVPAWLFAVADSTSPLAVVAVQPRFLTEPRPPRESPLGPPVQSLPTDPAVGGQPGRQLVTVDHAVASVRGVTVTYGESGTCPRRHVTGAAKENATTVVLIVEADVPGAAACTADYHPVQLVVALATPLGSRIMIDGSTGTHVH